MIKMQVTWQNGKVFIFFRAQAGFEKPVHSSSQQISVKSLKLDLGPELEQKRV